MPMLLLFIPIAWIVTAAGRTLTAWLGVPASATPSERNLVGFGLGLGLLSYGMLALGLLGLLYPLAGLLWVLALAALGGRQHAAMAREVQQRRPARMTGWGWVAAMLFAFFGLTALFGVMSPPVVFIPGVNATEWDSLSYHLADPKMFLRLHRIESLPWQPHSNFAFTAEMWYTLGLMAGSVPLAKCFHWACAAGSALALYRLGGRYVSPRTGLWAALLFVATPLVFWEAGTAYIDLATAFFTTMAVLCMAHGLSERHPRWLRLGAVMAGLALSTKATALATVLLLALGMVLWHWRHEKQPVGRALAGAAGWGLLALLVGSPWYVKSWLATGNPLYPYFFALFGGRWWDAAHAASYGATNNPGMGHGAVPALMLPWDLSLFLAPGHPTSWPKPFAEFSSPLLSLPPVLLGSLFFPAFGRAPVPMAVRLLAGYALASLLLWFTQTQFVRFLLPLVPVLCLLTAWTLERAWDGRRVSGYALAALAAGSLCWSLGVGGSLAFIQAPVALGLETQNAYESRYDATSDALRYINAALPPEAKLAFFGDPFGFHCDRPYLWGDQSAYVLTAAVHSAPDLLSRLHQLGVTHVLVDAKHGGIDFSPNGSDVGGWLYALTAAHGPPLYPQPEDRDRGILVYRLPP